MQDERRAEDDQLPDTGVGLSMERMLSSIFIRGESYGTRAISLLRRFDDGWTSLDERSYSANGRYLGHARIELPGAEQDRKSTRLNSSHVRISYAVFCLKKKRALLSRK